MSSSMAVVIESFLRSDPTSFLLSSALDNNCSKLGLDMAWRPPHHQGDSTSDPSAYSYQFRGEATRVTSAATSTTDRSYSVPVISHYPSELAATQASNNNLHTESEFEFYGTDSTPAAASTPFSYQPPMEGHHSGAEEEEEDISFRDYVQPQTLAGTRGSSDPQTRYFSRTGPFSSHPMQSPMSFPMLPSHYNTPQGSSEQVGYSMFAMPTTPSQPSLTRESSAQPFSYQMQQAPQPLSGDSTSASPFYTSSDSPSPSLGRATVSPTGDQGVGAAAETGHDLTIVRQPRKKRPRRKYDEIERIYKCGWGDCTKAYGTLNHLNAHVRLATHGEWRRAEEFKDVRESWKKKKALEKRAANAAPSRSQPAPAAGPLPTERERHPHQTETSEHRMNVRPLPTLSPPDLMYPILGSSADSTYATLGMGVGPSAQAPAGPRVGTYGRPDTVSPFPNLDAPPIPPMESHGPSLLRGAVGSEIGLLRRRTLEAPSYRDFRSNPPHSAPLPQQAFMSSDLAETYPYNQNPISPIRVPQLPALRSLPGLSAQQAQHGGSPHSSSHPPAHSASPHLYYRPDNGSGR